MRVVRFLVMFVPIAFAGATNALMAQAGTYTDGAGLGVLVTAIAAMTVLPYVLERNAKARANNGVGGNRPALPSRVSREE
jgi:ABC-type uncharacterized transport system permease subunit